MTMRSTSQNTQNENTARNVQRARRGGGRRAIMRGAVADNIRREKMVKSLCGWGRERGRGASASLSVSLCLCDVEAHGEHKAGCERKIEKSERGSNTRTSRRSRSNKMEEEAMAGNARGGSLTHSESRSVVNERQPTKERGVMTRESGGTQMTCMCVRMPCAKQPPSSTSAASSA